MESECETLRTSSTTSGSEISALNARIASLESSNRDALSLLDSKSTAHDKLAEEVTAQHQKTLDLRREVSNLEQSIQSANATASSAKYHEQSLEQEIEHLKRNNEWLDSELKAKSAEYSKYRKEKASRITELQRLNEDATNTIDTLNKRTSELTSQNERLHQKVEDYLSQIEQIREEASQKEKAFSIELDSANRLTELTRNAANTEKERLQDLQSQLEKTKKNASDELGQLSAELDTEHEARVAADRKVAELEVQIEQLEAERSTLQHQGATHQGVNGFAAGGRENTPSRAFSPSPARFKGAVSMTQMYSNLNSLQIDLDSEKRRNEKLSNTIDDMIRDLETRQPEVEELRSDHGRLELEVADLSSLVDVAGKERDQALKDLRKQEGQTQAKLREGELLRQQLRDLSSQVKILLIEAHLRTQGTDELDTESRLQLERLAQGQMVDDVMDDATDTDRFISENLVTFKNIADLQEQNANLLKLTRELGVRMEREEALQKTFDRDDLQQKYDQCKDQVKSLVTQSNSYIRERDMFRRMLEYRGQLPPGSDLVSMFGESIHEGIRTPTRGNIGQQEEESPGSRELAENAKLLREMQAHFDAYRQEELTNRSILKDQNNRLSRMNSDLQGEVARSSSKVTLGHERYEMLQKNYQMLKSENFELQKRAQHMSEKTAVQESRTQQVAEDLIEARGFIESMRNEISNLKAEKAWLKTVEKRLSGDHEALEKERNRLIAQSSSVQNLLNEREFQDNEARKRAQLQIDRLEKEVEAAQQKLSKEVEDNRNASLRREYDQNQNQKRLDDLVSSLSGAREQLVAATTTRDHLQGRVEEMTIELRSAEEKLQVIQPARNTSAAATSDNDTDNAETEGLSTEQELAVQVSELRRDLELSKSELENAKTQVEQYKAISQASEDELQSLNETHDLYRQETEKTIEERGAKIQELETRVQDLRSELESTSTEVSELRVTQSDHSHRLEEQRIAFETQLAQVKDEDDRHATAAKYYQDDLKAQVEIAQQAQSNYEQELFKHVEAAKALQKVREDYNELKSEAVEIKTEAESARASLSQSEESWAELRSRYEREMTNINIGREDLKMQNNRLHQQLDMLTNQISNLQSKHSANGTADDDAPRELNPTNDNMQEVVRYLRREKEIVDVQLELSTQEARRLKQSLDYTKGKLDEVESKLDQQRRSDQNQERATLDHNKLMETINELNTYRESNVTLRNESRQAQAALHEKTRQADELETQIQPLKEKVEELSATLEMQAGEMDLMKKDRDHWELRAQNILTKYDRVDPAELEGMKERLRTLEAERDNLKSSAQVLQEEVDSFPTQMAQTREEAAERQTEMRSRLTEQFKERSKKLTATIREKDSALQVVTKEREDLEQRVESQLQDLQQARNQDHQATNQTNEAGVGTQPENTSEDGQVDEVEVPGPAGTELSAIREELNAARARANEEAARSTSLQDDIASARSRIEQQSARIVSYLSKSKFS